MSNGGAIDAAKNRRDKLQVKRRELQARAESMREELARLRARSAELHESRAELVVDGEPTTEVREKARDVAQQITDLELEVTDLDQAVDSWDSKIVSADVELRRARREQLISQAVSLKERMVKQLAQVRATIEELAGVRTECDACVQFIGRHDPDTASVPRLRGPWHHRDWNALLDALEATKGLDMP